MRRPGTRPEGGAEDGAGVGARLVQVAIVGLAAADIGVVAGREREAAPLAAICCIRLAWSGLLPPRVDRAPVTEHRERERAAGSGGDLAPEGGDASVPSRSVAAQVDPVAVLACRR